MDIGKRIVIIGKTGSGKTTLARELAETLGYPHIELDSLYWQDNWQGLPETEFQEQIQKRLDTLETWIIDGNYNSSARPLIWPHADTVIWLDYPLHVSLHRLLLRTLSRSISRQTLWQTNNRENLWQHFFSRESLFLHALKQHRNHPLRYPHLMTSRDYTHIKFYRHQHPRETARFLQLLQHQMRFTG